MMAKRKTYEVTLESPDGKHHRVVACQAFSEEEARYIAERQEDAGVTAQAVADGKADDQVSARKYVEKNRYTVTDVVER